MRLRIRRQAWTGGVLALMLGIASGAAQTTAISSEPIPPSTEDALHAMSRTAGVIFAGQVTAVRRHHAAAGATGVVEIEFAVDDAIRGVRGSSYILREWGGLWASGYEPFQVGLRYLMLLHAPSSAGLSSPVGGTEGAIPIYGGGRTRAVRSGKIALAGNSATQDGGQVDLRWVATLAVRGITYRIEPVARAASLPVAVRAYTADAAGGQVNMAGPSTNDAAASVDGAAYTAVVGMLRTWEKGDDVAP